MKESEPSERICKNLTNFWIAENLYMKNASVQELGCKKLLYTIYYYYNANSLRWFECISQGSYSA
jgi:hypothetical protein